MAGKLQLFEGRARDPGRRRVLLRVAKRVSNAGSAHSRQQLNAVTQALCRLRVPFWEA